MAIKKLWLNSLENTRRTLARLIRTFHSAGEVDIQRFRTEIYALRSLIDCFKLEKEWEVVERLDAIEERLEEYEHDKN